MNTAKAAKSRRQQESDRGAVLVVVLLVMIALLGLGMTGLFLTGGSIQMNSNINLRNQALVVAEAGIERARAILNNPNLSPDIPALLGPTVANAADDPVQTLAQCQGADARRGAVLRDNGTALVSVAYPSVDRSTNLPGTGATTGATVTVSPTMGTYTVYIRQDLRDCRMGNFTCDVAPVAAASSTGGAGGAAGAGGSSGAGGASAAGVEACATPPPAGVPPNGVVIVRSEGVASDGRTRVVLEVTMSPSHGVGLGAGTPLSALCASGANGCDDNASVQTGIVVGGGPLPSQGGASGSGAGGTTGAGGGTGAAGGAGGTTGALPGAGGASAGGAAGTVSGAGGAGGGGSGGSSGCKSTRCARIATLGVWGLWNRYVSRSSNDSGSAMFREWLDQANDECQMVGSITDFGGGRLLTSGDTDPLKNYNVLILLDMYHTNADRWGCASHWEVTLGSKLYGCSWPQLNCYPDGNASYKDCPLIGQNTCGQQRCDAPKCSFNRCCNNATGACEKPNYDCTVCGTDYARNTTSYQMGHQPVLTTPEIDYISEWVQRGNAIVTTAGYYYDAPHVESINKILRRFGLKYDTRGGSDTGKVIKSLEAADGVDLCSSTPSGTPGGGCPGGDGGGDFLRGDTPGHYPFDFRHRVDRLQVRGAIPLVPVSGGLGTPELSVRVQCPRPIKDTYYGNNTSGGKDQKCNQGPPAACGTNESDSTYWRNIGYTVKDIGAGGGRVVAWGDEWLTYNTLWSAWNKNVYDPNEYPCQSPSSVVYQASAFWDNIIGWLTENKTCN